MRIGESTARKGGMESLQPGRVEVTGLLIGRQTERDSIPKSIWVALD